MKLSDIFKFKLFEGSDKANLKIVNENFEIAEKELAATNKEIADKVTEINDRITELNGLLGGKLDVTKIANNLVTTEEGYALDARMGKALSDRVIYKTACVKTCPANSLGEGLNSFFISFSDIIPNGYTCVSASPSVDNWVDVIMPVLTTNNYLHLYVKTIPSIDVKIYVNFILLKNNTSNN